MDTNQSACENDFDKEFNKFILANNVGPRSKQLNQVS